GPPENFGASQGASDYFVQLSWSALQGSIGYVLQRQVQGGAFSTLAEGLPADTFSYKDLDVQPSTSYVYRLAGIDKDRNTGPFSQASGSTGSGNPQKNALTLTASNPSNGGGSFP